MKFHKYFVNLNINEDRKRTDEKGMLSMFMTNNIIVSSIRIFIFPRLLALGGGVMLLSWWTTAAGSDRVERTDQSFQTCSL